jgi:nicotinate dehydrogenase subunit A
VTESFRLRVNGVDTEVTAAPDTPLLTVLRNELGLVGSRFGCGLGLCGACFVRMDDAVVPSCDTPVWSAAGRSVTTVEGLAPDGELHPVQQALIDHQAAQCGFCISGIAVRAAALLEENPSPDAPSVAEALDRNLCRCGAQRRIIAAVVDAGRATARTTARTEEPTP